MKKHILLFVAIIAFVACNSSASTSTTSQSSESETAASSEDQTEPKYQKVSLQIFKEKLAAAKDPIILDVRTPQETASGTIPNAKTINFYDDDFKDQVNQLDKTKPVFVYCKSGGRSGQAMKIMETLGFQEVYDLIGGYTAYAKE